MSRPGIRIRVALLIVLTWAGSALAQTTTPMTNDDIVRMVEAQLGTRIILTTIRSVPAVAFDVSPEALIALREAGVGDPITETMIVRAGPRRRRGRSVLGVTRNAPERSDVLGASASRESVLRTFRTMAISASRAKFFGSAELRAALIGHEGFTALNVTIVDNMAVADVILNVSYTFAWDFPFTLTYVNTSVVLASGKGVGPFSGPLGAASVADEIVRLLRPHRTAATVSVPATDPGGGGGNGGGDDPVTATRPVARFAPAP